jgi:nucleotide-binding universal stress UspA family protein
LARTARVVVGVSESPAGLRALRAAVEQARIRHRELLAVRAFDAPKERGLQQSTAAATLPGYESADLWSQTTRMTVDMREKDAARVIERAFEQAMGGTPDDPAVCATARLGRPGPILVDAAHLEEDLLVIGATTPQWRRQLGRSTARYCTFYAACPVLLIPSPS